MKSKILMGVVGVSFLIMNGCSSDFEKGMKQGCMNNGGSRSFCTCFYDKMEAHYGEEKLTAIGMMQVKVPEDFEEVSFQSGQQCVHKL
ncbi:hypothetical protein ACG9WR_15350 [Acinetobacter pittii]|uniref:hypothetical protein n=1 Tax=Acinetobacter pittii TaxID=48296 RepID=UPI00300BBB89